MATGVDISQIDIYLSNGESWSFEPSAIESVEIDNPPDPISAIDDDFMGPFETRKSPRIILTLLADEIIIWDGRMRPALTAAEVKLTE